MNDVRFLPVPPKRGMTVGERLDYLETVNGHLIDALASITTALIAASTAISLARRDKKS